MKTIGKAIILTAGISILGAGCVVRERTAYRQPVYADSYGAEVDVAGAPPAPIEETVTLAPDPSFIWIGGAYAWGGGRWRWEGGHWARPPHPGAVWVPHRYAYRNGRHVWVRGGWR